MTSLKRCPFLGCNHQYLESVEEFDIGFCSRHHKESNDTEYFVLACWNCLTPIETTCKEAMVKKARVKDDYVFAQKCPHCSTIEIVNLQFVTITNDVDTPSLYVSDEGILSETKYA